MEQNQTAANNVKISKNVRILGIASLFNDIASESIYPIIPIFLTSILGAPVSVVGLVEGLAESVSSIVKVFFGSWSDKIGKRKTFVISGYFLSAFSKIMLSLAYIWPTVLLARFFDRFGKGIRTSPRDALIADNSVEANRGKSFGFHRALDTSGAVIGPLLGLLALKLTNNDFRLIFFMAFIPGLFCILLLIFFIKEKAKTGTSGLVIKGAWRNFGRPYKIFLLISLIFTLSRSSDAFLILRAKNLGLTITMTIFVYVLFNFSYAVLSTPAGILSDKIGQKKILIVSFFLFSLVSLLFGLAHTSSILWWLFPFYGLYMAVSEGIGKAYIANLVSEEVFGTAFGIYQTVIGVVTFFASVIAGLLWTYVSVSTPFIFGSIMAAIAGLLFFLLVG